MPIYEVTQDATGVTLELEGDRPPTKEDVERAFAFAGRQKYPEAPVLQAPPSLLEQAKAVAPAFMRVAAPFRAGAPMPQDIATVGRTIQQIAGKEPQPGMLEGASRIEKEGVMAILPPLIEREKSREIGRRLGEAVSEYTPIPEYISRPAGEIAVSTASDLLSPMNLMTLGVAGAARQAARIPSLAAAAGEFAEGVAPSAARAAQIADLRRAAETARVTTQVGEAISAVLAPEMTRGAAESAGIAMQTIADPNASNEEKLRASFEATLGTLFAAGLGAQAARTLGMRGRKGVTQADVLENLASQKQTVGEAINKVSGLIDQMDRIVPVENLRTQFRELIAGMNPDEPFIYRPEPIGEGPRTAPEGGRLPAREIVEPEVPETLRTQDQILAERLRARDERIAAEEQAALEREAARAGTPLRTAEEVQAQRAAERQAFRERSAAIRKAIGRREFTAEELMRGEVAPEAPVAEPVSRPLITPELSVERAAAREGGMLPPREAEAPVSPEGTRLRSLDDIIAERLRAREERLAAEQAAAARTSTPLETVEQKLTRALAQRDKRLAAEAVAETLESGAAQGESVRLTRKKVEEAIGIGRKEAGLPVAEQTIFNEVWNKAVEETQGKPKPIESSVPKPSEQPSQRMKLFVDGIEGQTVSPDQVPNGNPAFEYAVGSTTEGGLPAIYRRNASEKGTYGGWRWENDVSKLNQPKPKSFRQKAEGIAQQLEGLRTQVEPGLGANPFPQLMGAAWNGALSVAQAVIRAGGSVADGVAAGLRYARENFKDKFDEAEFSKQLTGTISRPSPIQVPPKMEARAFSERMAAAPGIPPVIREAIAQSPESSYVRQSLKQVAQQAELKTDQQLVADISNPDSNTRTADTLELANRKLNEGKMSEFLELSIPLSKNLTTAGQIINQAKLLNSTTPAGFVLLVSKTMEKFGKKITPEQASKLGDTMNQYRKTIDSIKKAEIKMRDSANKGDIQGERIASGVADFANANLGKVNFDLLEQIYRINPASATDLYISLVQGSVMAPLSIWKNTVYNAIRKPPNAIADMLAAGIDSAFYGGKNNPYDLRARTVTQIKEFAKSVPEAFKVMLKGSDINPYEIGTSVGSPLNFQRAWRSIAKNFAEGKYGAAFSPRLLAEGTLGVYADILLRAAQATDLPFRKAKYASLIEEFGKMRGMSDSQIRVATRNPKLMLISDEAQAKGQRGFTADDIGRIEFLAAREVYQQENLATEGFAGVNRFIRDATGPVGYIPYRFISLFQKTPINVGAEAVQYMPTGIFRQWSKLSQAERNIAASRLMVGSIIGSAFYYLYGKGVITANLDTPGETNKARELAKAGGVMPPGTLNSSGLYRLIRGGDPSFKEGDEVKELASLGVTGAIGTMVATLRRLQERSRTDDPDLTVMLKAAGISGLNYIMEQQFLKNTSGFLKFLSEESGTSMDRLLRTLAVTATSPIAPAILGAKRRAERENLPAIGGEGFIKDSINEMNQRYAALGLAIPGVKDPNAMPVRRDLWGNAVKQTPKGENPYVYNFFDAWKSRSIEADPLNASLYKLWRKTADNTAIPSIPNPVLTYHDKTFERMTPEQYDRYSQLVGFYRRVLAEQVYTGGQYHQSGDEVRLRLMNSAYERGLAIGKYVFLRELRESGQSLTPQAGRRGFTAE